MNVACTACPAKYAVPDDKVRGRKVKITCKHCGTAIVVDGTKMGEGTGGAPSAEASVAPAKATVVPLTDGASVAPAAKPAQAETTPEKAAPHAQPQPAAAAEAAPAAQPAPAAIPESAPAPAPEPPAEVEWIVAFTDDRQDPATTQQVVEFYRAGHIDESTYVWREGMDDWAAPFDIPELRDALTAAGVARRSPPPPMFGDDDEATRVANSPLISGDATTSSSGIWREPGRPAGPAKLQIEEPAVAPKPQIEKPPPAESPKAPAASTTKRKSERPAAAAKAEPAKPQPTARAATKTEPAQRTAAARRRTERAAAADDLFGSVAQAGSEQDVSLHAEGSAADAEAHRMTGQRNESSVLFSLDALIKTEKSTTAKAPARKKDEEAAILFGEPAPNSIANVGTGGIGVALAAPDFTAPVAAPPPSAPRSAAAPIEVSAPAPQKKKSSVGLIAALLVLGGGAAAAFAMGIPQKFMAGPGPTTTASAEPPKAAATTEPAATSEPAAAPTISATGSAPGAPGSAPAAGSAPAKSGEAVPAKSAEAKPAEAKPEEAKPGDKPKDAPPPSGDLPPFDRAAAAAALGAAAANASSCRQPGGAMGSGRVTVTFAPSGRATSTNVSGEVAGTTVGGCVARLFKSVKIPPFSGDPITVGKSFTVE